MVVEVAQQCRGVYIPDCAGETHRPRGYQASRNLRLYILCLGIVLLFINFYSPRALAQNTEDWVATLKSVEGPVEVRKAAQTEWLPAKLNETYTIGASIRVLAYGRAAILLPDETVLRLDQNTTVTFTEPEDTNQNRTLLELIKGAIHVISRNPRALKVSTPFAGAGLEGTEFLIEVTRDETLVTVFEGEINLSTNAGNVKVASGQRATARSGQQPAIQIAVRPRDAVQWTLYYPPVLDREISTRGEAIEAEQVDNPQYYAARASRRLAVGRVDEARADIEQALDIEPTNVDALSLQSIVALAQNNQDAALSLANRALAQNPDSAAALIALSYAQQARFDIPAALSTLQVAADRNEENGLVWARLSELQLAVGKLDEALEAAEMAVSKNPDIARSQTVRGFAYLTQGKITRSLESFRKAIILDQSAPLPRLGLGLARIRNGDLTAGRAEIEIAVVLDPGNALIRSYMGKAYYEETRDDLAASQYAMAKELDPLDPTPWYFDAIRKQTENQPVAALADLEASIERNDNRAVYRSRSYLDRDRAARGASQARIYKDLGFEQLGVVEGTIALSYDPANHSAHRFLSDSYAAQPRHEISQASELLQSQLYQPINIFPVQPQVPEIDLNIVAGAGPAEAAFNEFTPLFESNGHQFAVSALAGNNNTWADELVLSGIRNRVSYSIGQFHHESDGFRINNDIEHDIYNLFVQAELNEKADIQFEFRKRESEQGDLRLNFDPSDFSISKRKNIEQNIGRLGLHLAPSPQSDFVLSLIRTDREDRLHQMDSMAPILDSNFDTQSDDLQGQYLYRGQRFNVTAGLGVSRIDIEGSQIIDISPTFPGGICHPSPRFSECVP